MGKGTRKLRNNLRQIRQDRNNMTQQELADLVGITRQTVNAIEGNKYSPSLEVAFMIAEVLSAGINDVFQYDRGAA